jgi:uncharacterized protein RhaS with RHS repeats
LRPPPKGGRRLHRTRGTHTRRRTQEDPIGLAGGLNLYGYGAGDPVNNSDPFGLCPWDEGDSGSEVTAGTSCYDGAAAIGMVLFSALDGARGVVSRAAAGIRHSRAVSFARRASRFAGDVPTAENAALNDAITNLFRAGDEIPGGTAGALRYEILTGARVGGKSHLRKAAQRLVQLRRILKREKLSDTDRATATAIADDLQDAINTKPPQ